MPLQFIKSILRRPSLSQSDYSLASLRKNFHSDLDKLLKKGTDFNKVTPLDLFFAYRLLLQRAPEFDDRDKFRTAAETTDLHGLVKKFLRSPEFAIRWEERAKLPEVPVLIDTSLGFRMYFYLSDTVVGWGVASGSYEEPLRRAIQACVKPGMVCCDLGANIGYFSLFMSQLSGPAGAVYAFEPFPKNFTLLSRSIRENQLTNVHASPYAVHEKTGNALLFIDPQNNSDYVAMFVGEKDCSTGFDTLEIKQVLLDDIVPESVRVGCIKMDIEGSELHAVGGMSRILKRDRPTVFFEFAPSNLRQAGGSDPEELLKAFRSHQYRLFRIEQYGSGNYEDFNWKPEIDGQAVHNLAAVPL